MDELRPGEVFEGRYRIDALLGAGGFGRVFLAFDARTSRRVALKVLTPDRGEHYDPATRARFARETAAVASLRSPHVVALLDCGESADGLLYMIFEFVPGDDLATLLAQHGRLEPPVVVHIVRQLLGALREAHAQGILHRDIKPENIRVSEFQGDAWTVKLLDFGLARSGGAHDSVATAAGQLVGTPRYMAPEQLTEDELTPATDIYALGMVTAELLLGRDALAGNQWSDQLERLQSGFVLSIPEADRIGPGLVAIVQRMTARRPADRFHSAVEVLAALEALEGPRPRPAAPPARNVSPPSRASHSDRSRRPALPMVIAATAALIAVAIAAYVRRPDPPDPVVPVVVRTENPLGREREARSVGPAAPAPRDSATSDPCAAGLFDFEDTAYITQLRGVGVRPSKYSREHDYPLVVLLHQVEEPPAVLLRHSGFCEVAEREGVIVIAPQSPPYPVLGLPADWSPWTGPGDQDARQVRRVVEQALEEFSIDPRRVFLVGHGQGGRVANRLACDPMFRAVATTSFRESTDDEFCAEPKPFLLVNPTKSRREPLDGGDSCGVMGSGGPMLSLAEVEAGWRKRNGCKGAARQRPIGTSVCETWSCATPFESCRLDGGHPWPGTPPRPVTERLFPGCDGKAPDFPLADHVWTFFAAVR